MAANDANEQTDPKATPAPDTKAEAANVADAQPAPAPVTVNIVQQDKNAEAAANMAAGKAKALDVASQEGGVYLVNGQLTNANGDPVGTSLDKSRT